MLSQVIEEEGHKHDGESGFVETHDFLHQHAIHQLAEPVRPIVDVDHVLLGGRAGGGDETDPLGGNAPQTVEKVGNGHVLVAGRGGHGLSSQLTSWLIVP